MKVPSKSCRRPPNILEALAHPDIFGPLFEGPSWDAHRALLAAMFALPMTPPQLALYQACTGRTEPPTEQAREAWLLCGRRSGKSKILAMIALYCAFFKNWSRYLSAGERAVISIVAADKAQAKVIFDYLVGMLRSIPVFAKKLIRETLGELELAGGLSITINAGNYRTIRGRTIVVFLADEICFWRDAETSASPADEVLAAVRPAQATVPGALMICASSPYSKSGPAWQTSKRYFGKDGGRILVWQNAPSRLMNPTLSQDFIDAELSRDPVAGRSEYLGEWRDDISAFVSREVAEAAVIPQRWELPPVSGIAYTAGVDVAGGSGSDSFTVAISYRTQEGIGVLAALREFRPPFDPASTVEEVARLFRSYRISQVHGDAYSGDWAASRFRENGITYTFADKTKSQFYTEFLPQLNARRLELLDNNRLLAQLCALERRVVRGSSREVIDHPVGAGQHDDLINSVAISLVMATQKPPLKIDPSVLKKARQMGRPGERASLQAARGHGSAVYCGGQSFPSRWRGN